MHSPHDTAVDVKPYSTSELAHLYHISIPTMRKWLRAHELFIGKRVGRIYSVKQVVVIFDRLGMPPED